ncbi:type I-D CRISPR-associated helicase Cas3' [Floridanema evergladense]|uniref:Type I-D CRISPR-associated helicase Cas3 n=1 Tax=Floridaenema evergladense BLCC-F167 TaxID=3153639 RepID=A0ABV4WIL1_9CYAN
MNNDKLSIQLEPKSIAACSVLPSELAFMANALQHQVDVFEKSRNHNIILDLAPTGTGKTNAGLSILLHQPNKSAVYIAPTNALITQQAEAAEKFVRNAGLPHVVKAASAKQIKTWSNDKVGKRSGEKLYNVLRNPATIFPEIGANKPILLITNPDIFYYATFFAYNNLDRGNIAAAFYTKFATVIFDEFHLYDAKQLVGLLFYLALSHVFGFFKDGRRVVLLTATPEPACEAALKTLEEKGVRIAKIDGESDNSNLLPSQTAVNLEIRPQLDRDEWLTEIANEVAKRLREQADQNGAVILDSKDHINRLADLLKIKGLENKFGRITGSTPQADRKIAAQKQIILATSTVDVGFNFERHPAPTRQNLDWLIFSTRDRFSFWQRIGRVGRILGKTETDIPSEAISYLPAVAWEQGITSLDCSGGRTELKQMLDNLPCLERPFLEIYWRSEAFLEIARPLLELEESLDNLSQIKFISELFETLKLTLGGKKDWNHYRYRMKVLKGAENIANASLKEIKTKWMYIKCGQAFVKKFLEVKYPAEWADIDAGVTKIEEFENVFKEDDEAAKELKDFAEVWKASYAPLFQFREGLFESLPILDPKGLLLDESDQTVLDPIHLLRYYEFAENGEFIEVMSRAEAIYELSFRLRYLDSAEEFKNKEINKLTAFENCRIERTLGSAIAPTPLLKELEKNLLPGVIISTEANQWVIIRLRKQGIASYPISVSCNDFEKKYTFFPGLSGILAIAMYEIKLKLPDDENFYVI